MRRILSLLLAIVMVFAAVPAVTIHGVDTEADAAPENAAVITSQPEKTTVCPDVGLPTVKEYFDAVRSYSFKRVDTFEEAAVELRDRIIAREDIIEIEFEIDLDKISTVVKDLYNAATVHSDISTSGDYITCGGVSWSSEAYVSGVGGRYTCHITYDMDYFTTAEQEAELNDEIDELLEDLDLWDASDYEKIAGVYDYMCDNITYDFDNLYDDTYLLKHTAYAALINKTSVCQGYALLFYRLMLELDVDARVIVGIGNGGGHAWNIVELGEEYYLLDATWDAGRNEYDWFLLGSDNFEDHVSNYEYLTAEFQSQYPIDKNDYVHQPPHIHNYIATVTPPTCTEEGYTTYTCVCGDVYIADAVEMLSHNYGEWVITTEPTCAVIGEKTKTCSDCGDEITEDVPALGHTPTIDKAVDPTCDEIGYTEGSHCSVCGEVIVAQEEIPALGHDEVIDEAVDPTCTEAGYTEGSHCSRCDKVIVAQEEIPALGHDYVNGECSRCGEEEVMFVYADINGDEEITAVDAAMTYAVVNGKFEATEAQLLAVDVNGDGEVTAVDAAMIYAYVNGKLSSFPVD